MVVQMKKAARQQKAHAPVNPLTGLPNDVQAEASDQAEPQVPQSQVATGVYPSWTPGVGATHVASEAGDVSQPHEPSFVSDASSTAGESMASGSPDANAELKELISRVLDSRVVSVALLFVLLVMLLGIEHFILFACALFLGYILVDRFANVRRCVVLGGTAWLLMLFAGGVIADNLNGPLVFGLDYLFMFCGFLLAAAVCSAYFAGHKMYERGLTHGREQADQDIAKHMVERLIERPDDWDDLDGDYLEVEAALNRVRERERMAAQALRDEARRKDDLVTYLAHDLKTPLASVVGYLSLLEEAPDLPVEQRAHFTGIALEKAHRLDALIEEFFDITRFDFHDIVLTRGYVDLNLLLSQVADEFYPQLTEQHKAAQIDVPAGLVVLVDGDKMARVFNNVMKNAIAYSYEGSTITISAECTESIVTIRFSNQGDPIPAAKLNVIFEKFYRLDAARATNRGGAGLGLAIAKEIVTAHGGTITCTSSPEETVFTITLPV